MDASTFKKLARSPVASALVGVVALGALLAMPTRESAARAPAGDGDLAGLARVIDGDTLEIAGRHVRLEGIDAPESGQTCGRRLIGSWRCGSAAADALAKLVAKRRVSCESRGNDKYDRMLGICFVDGRDINAEMVREGYAWAFVKYSQTYVKQEAEARIARVGIWQGDAEPAWVYREKRWAGAEQEAPKGCAIKGNVTEHGHIYHMPWSPWYGKVKVDEANGERWFCSEAEAISAGWRAAAQQ
jgi:endonuclease YncB( thermonuclease family)